MYDIYDIVWAGCFPMLSVSLTPLETGVIIELETGAPVQVWPTVMWSGGGKLGFEPGTSCTCPLDFFG